ncbi:hypothetical protein H5410_016370 [Solanum commersonii]|uniref:Putative plant transposon protein domain-containing protein n=1 Tax=Solanum commersonii TaxID=4109 RepID=A0A9J5ZX75_SOLCO|nr:hypothetical protein H5410_016370 [Solanum commersonii]
MSRSYAFLALLHFFETLRRQGVGKGAFCCQYRMFRVSLCVFRSVDALGDIMVISDFEFLSKNHLMFIVVVLAWGKNLWVILARDRLLSEWLMINVTMSSSQKPDNEVATSSNRKRVRNGNVVTKEGKAWYKKHTEATYFSDVCVDEDSLAREFPQIWRQIRELGMEVVFADPDECNLHMVREFYANWAPEARSNYVTVRGKNVPITPTGINEILGTPGKRYYKSLPYAHMLRETRVWLKVVMNCLIPGLHYIDITRDRVCLVYALMTGMELNTRAIIKSSIRKARVHKGHMYAFGGLITKMCCVAGVPEKNVDYVAPLYSAPVDITRTKGPDTKFDPTLITVERHMRDELIMARMYGMEMLRHKIGGRPSTDLEIGEVNKRYFLNDHAKALLGIGPEFREPTENDILTDEDNLRTNSNMESDLDEEIDPIQAGVEANGGDIMED